METFDDGHSHHLCSDEEKLLLKANRKLSYMHQNFILNCGKANLGHVKSYKLYRQMCGSFSSVGATVTEFKNFRRDLNSYLEGVDAQMVVEKFMRREEYSAAFYFDYDVDVDGCLTRLFWADCISRKNFLCFGDVVSADATYKKNRYLLHFNLSVVHFKLNSLHFYCVPYCCTLYYVFL